MNKLFIIPNSDLRNIKVQDNHEPLVDLRKECPALVFKIPYYVEKNGGAKAVEDAHFARKSIAQKLNSAQSALPTSLKLSIDGAYRSPKMQQKSYDAVLKNLRKEKTDWSEEKLKEEMTKRVSEVDIAPHCTGGAIDLTIVDSNNKPLDMGTKIDEYSELTYTNADLISNKAKQNRTLLIDIMTKAGFINFPAEWWHWSYGDREWAYFQPNKTAIYAAIER
ncbi:MAG TPA: M15 family metallopeptidase [Candidatus Woesebacteria bacterium]|nr:M15 family metallopeptidase [Candidatus Woesebacteria bacterium]